MTLAVKVALNPNTTNQPTNLFFVLNALKKVICSLFQFGPVKILSSGNGLTNYNIIIKLQNLENIKVDV